MKSLETFRESLTGVLAVFGALSLSKKLNFWSIWRSESLFSLSSLSLGWVFLLGVNSNSKILTLLLS